MHVCWTDTDVVKKTCQRQWIAALSIGYLGVDDGEDRDERPVFEHLAKFGETSVRIASGMSHNDEIAILW